MNTSIPPFAKDLPTLTGLRFLAAAMVLVHHAGLSGGVPVLSEWRGFGTTGVSFFFVLSGFVLTWGGPDKSDILTFYANRVFRIWPLLFVTTLIAIPIFYAGRGLPYNWQAIGFSLAGLQAWSTSPDIYFGANPVAWSISDEAFFYLVHPFIAMLLWRGSKRWIVAALAGTLVLQYWLAKAAGTYFPDLRTWFTYMSPAFRVLEFAIGMMAAMLVHRRLPLPRAIFNVPFALMMIVCWFYVFYSVAPHVASQYAYKIRLLHYAVLPLLYCVLIVSAAETDLANKRNLFSTPLLVKLGHWSFALYLVHSSVIYLSILILGRRPDSNTNLVWYMVLMAFSLVIAGLLHELVEKPLNSYLRKRWKARRAKNAESAATLRKAEAPL